MKNAIIKMYWADSFDEAWAMRLHGDPDRKLLFLQNLTDVDDMSRACEAVRVLFKDQTSQQISEVLFDHRHGASTVGAWIGTGKYSDQGERTFVGAPLLKTACDLGLNLSHIIRAQLPDSNNVIETTELGLKIAFSPTLFDIDLELDMEATGLLLAHGAPLDDATLHPLLTLHNVELAQRWFDFLAARTEPSASRLIRVGHREHVEQNTLAYFSALAAHETVNVTCGQGLRFISG